jgi:hypothetical protein
LIHSEWFVDLKGEDKWKCGGRSIISGWKENNIVEPLRRDWIDFGFFFLP